MDEADWTSHRLPTEGEAQRKRWATRGFVRCGPAQRAEPPRPNVTETSLSESNSEQELALEVSGRRLRLERTFNQSNENAMEGALEGLKFARRLPTTAELRAKAIVRAASLANSIHKQLETRDVQLKKAMVEAATVRENEQWAGFKPAFLSPTRVLAALRPGTTASWASSIAFTNGPWAGQQHSIEALVTLAEMKDWPVKVTPAYIKFLELSYELIAKIDGGQVQGATLLELELELAYLFNDYWGLNVLLTFHNYLDDLEEVIVPYLPLDLALSIDDFYNMATKMSMTNAQLSQCKVLREQARESSELISTSAEVPSDLLRDLVELDPDRDDFTLVILESVDALRQVDLKRRALEVEITHKLLFEILEPVQCAKFLTWIRLIIVHPISQWKEWMRLVFPCILGADDWMDWYVPYDAPFEIPPLVDDFMHSPLAISH